MELAGCPVRIYKQVASCINANSCKHLCFSLILFDVVNLKHPCLSDWPFEIIPISTSVLATGKIIAPAMLTSRTFVGAVTCASWALCRHPVAMSGTATKLALWWHDLDHSKIWRKSLDALWDTCDKSTNWIKDSIQRWFFRWSSPTHRTY